MKIIECPRDAMQGIDTFIPTEKKIEYINQILKCGFDTVDFGSFVSPKAIPQLKDTAEVLRGLNLKESKSKLLAIIANTRGAEDACHFPEINYLGFPFSISETFQQRNTNSTIDQSLTRVEEVQNLCLKNNKQLVVYVSMAFGNPYGDKWDIDIAYKWTNKLAKELDIKIIALADTIGVSNPENIQFLFKNLIPEFADVELGAHLHTTPDKWQEKVEAVWESGCRRIDTAIKGFGGCPMASDNLTGNMATENVLFYLEENKIESHIDKNQFNKALKMATFVFPNH